MNAVKYERILLFPFEICRFESYHFIKLEDIANSLGDKFLYNYGLPI